MSGYSLKDTIHAPASAPQRAGIIVVRVSGERVVEVIERLGLPALEPRYATLVDIYHTRTRDLIDQGIAVYFKAPHSFTGEDVLELSIHGGRAVLKSLLDALSSVEGLRFAEPGEFSMRALFNGKLDLTQAEGLADLINAETSEQHKLAIKQLSGSLSKVYEAWRKKLLEIMGLIEAHIDFPEEDIPEDLVERASKAVNELNLEIKSYLQDNNVGEKLREGLYVAILGSPNVGKSSLLNKLSKRDVAIVSNIAGTTRDVIEVELEIKGYPVIIADTAGIRESSEAIENEGIKRALERANRADCKLIVLDATSPVQPQSILDLIDSNSIVVENKIDLLDVRQSASLHSSSQRKLGSSHDNPSKRTITLKGKANDLFEESSILDPSLRWDDECDETSRSIVYISTETGEGLDELISRLSDFTEKFFYSAHSTPLITRQRHREYLTACSECLSRFSIPQGIEFAAEDLRLAASNLARITDRIDADSVLGEIFSNFCIGK